MTSGEIGSVALTELFCGSDTRVPAKCVMAKKHGVETERRHNNVSTLKKKNNYKNKA